MLPHQLSKMQSTNIGSPAYAEIKTEKSPLLPAYNRSDGLPYDHEVEIYKEIQNYYDSGQYDEAGISSPQSLSSSTKWKKFLLPFIYTVALTTATFLHQSILGEKNVPYFLMAVYNTIAVVVAAFGITYNSCRQQINLARDAENYKSVGIRQLAQDRSDRWKLFAFVFLYMASEEGFWFSQSSLDLFRQRVAYLAYPLFVALFTLEWVFSGKKERLVKGVEKKDLQRLKMAVVVGGLGVCWSYQTSFEWWACMVGVALLGFKNVVTRDILMTSSQNAPELVMLAGSAVSFRALVSCYGSAEYSLIWPHLMGVSWQCCAKVLVVGVCYGIAQLVSVEMGRLCEPVRGGWMVMAPAVVGAIGCLVWGI